MNTQSGMNRITEIILDLAVKGWIVFVVWAIVLIITN